MCNILQFYLFAALDSSFYQGSSGIFGATLVLIDREMGGELGWRMFAAEAAFCFHFSARFLLHCGVIWATSALHFAFPASEQSTRHLSGVLYAPPFRNAPASLSSTANSINLTGGK